MEKDNIKLTSERFLSLYDDTISTARALALRKNAEYGSSFAKHGAIGCVIRISDKLDRHIAVTRDRIRVSEKLEDDLLDCINYLVYAHFLLTHEVKPNDIEESKDKTKGNTKGKTRGNKDDTGRTHVDS